MAKKKAAETTKTGQKPRTVDFEDALKEVESIVDDLEHGDLGLAESLKRYERGITKIKLCHELLEQAEKRISLLTAVDDDGTAHLEPVDTSASQDAGAPAAGSRRKRRGVANKSAGKKSAGQEPGSREQIDESGGLF